MDSKENSQCFPEKNNETPDTHAIISNLLNRVMEKLRNEFISNLDNSKMNKDKAKRILHITSQIESLLDILLTEMEENGFAQLMPKGALTK